MPTTAHVTLELVAAEVALNLANDPFQASQNTGVASWNGRTGDVFPIENDYTSSQVVNLSTVAGTYVTDALNVLEIDKVGGSAALLVQYRIPVVGAAAGDLDQSAWLINGSTMTAPATSEISAATLLSFTTPLVAAVGSGGFLSTQAATQDGLRLLGRAGGTSSYIGTLTPVTLTASRTYTLPNANILFAGSSSELTSGRVPYASTGGVLIDSANLLFNGTTFTTHTLTVTTGALTLPAAGTVSSATSISLSSPIIIALGAGGVTSTQSATQDGMQLLGRSGGSSSFVGTLTPTTLTASRTYTFPDATGTVITTGNPANHNDLLSIQGGTSSEYYHLTSVQHSAFVGLSTQYAIPVVGAAAGVLSESTWSINGSTMTAPAISEIEATTSLGLDAPFVGIGGATQGGIESLGVTGTVSIFGDVGIGTVTPREFQGGYTLSGQVLNLKRSGGTSSSYDSSCVLSAGRIARFWFESTVGTPGRKAFSLDYFQDTLSFTGRSESTGADQGSSLSLLNNGDVGIGTGTPGAKLDSFETTEQFRTTYTPGTVYTSQFTDSDGYHTIAPTGGRVINAGELLVNTSTQYGSETFAVNGDVYVNGDITANGSLNLIASSPSWSPGQQWYDSVTKTIVSDTGYTGVRVNNGQETHIRFYNDTGVTITNGTPVNASGVDVTNGVVKGIVADAASPQTSSAVIGLATADVLDGEVGVAARLGEVNDIDTSLLGLGGILYLAPGGGLTNTRPQEPETILILGTVEIVNASTGRILVDLSKFRRRGASRSYSFTSQGIGTGTWYKGGFYDWSATDSKLDEGSTTQTYGTSGTAYAAHAGCVPSGPGTVNTGQVGLRVTATEDSETGAQIATQVGIITEDITTLTADVMAETSGKFSGQVTYDLYIVSGSPTAYSLDFNYGYSKYEDFGNRDATVTGIDVVWQGGANDTGFDVALLHHQAAGWTYAATGFTPGNGHIARRSVDQAIDGNVTNGIDGAWKRINLNQFVAGNGTEGVIYEIITGNNNTVQTMDLHISAVSEELTK